MGYPKDGFRRDGDLQQVQIYRDSAQTVTLPEVRTFKFSAEPDALATEGVLDEITLAAGTTAALTPDGQPDIPRTLQITGDAESLAAAGAFSIVGTDAVNAAISEAIAVTNGTAETVSAFKSITTITATAEESYTIFLDTPSSGTYLLGNAVDGWTTALAYDANAAAILAALEIVYGESEVTSVTADGADFIVLFLSGEVAALEIDGASLVGAGAETCTMDDLGEVSIGIGRKLGVAANMDIPAIAALSFDGAQIDDEDYAHSVDDANGLVCFNLVDPGSTVGAAFDGTKRLDAFIFTPARQ